MIVYNSKASHGKGNTAQTEKYNIVALFVQIIMFFKTFFEILSQTIITLNQNNT